MNITQVCNSVNLTCSNVLNPCPFSYILNATCPVGYVRLSFIDCSMPISPTFTASFYINPYSSNIYGCSYNGLISSFTTESLTIRIFCIQDFQIPCFIPPILP